LNLTIVAKSSDIVAFQANGAVGWTTNCDSV